MAEDGGRVLEPAGPQLRALYEAGLALAGDLRLDAVLQQVVDLARQLAGARYGALGIFGANGELEQFITSGITPEDRARIGPLPRGRGLLGEVREGAAPLRVGNIGDHPASVGFPRGHPRMTSFLGIPVASQGNSLGMLYLTDKLDAPEFTDQDAALLELFAAQAAVAVENARVHHQIQLQADQLREVYQTGLALAEDLSLDAVLQRVVDLARELTGATYGALGVLGPGDALEQFLTSGISAQERERVGALPVGRGLLGEMLRATEPLRVRNIAEHPASVGFPPGHPRMTSFLGVPVIHRGRTQGSIYLTDKRGADEFSEEDAALLGLFAAQAGLAIENARLYERVQQLAVEEERQRIAREMHDGLAQVLGYVNVQVGAVRRLVELGRNADATGELERLEEAARDAYADIREGILSLRVITQKGAGLLSALGTYLRDFSEQSGIKVDLVVEHEGREVTVPPDLEVQLIRIVQEALSNVRKHSKATGAEVRFGADPSQFTVAVRDNGSGFRPDRLGATGGPRFGLQIMRERAESLGGTLEIGTAPGTGTTVTVRVPRRRRMGK